MKNLFFSFLIFLALSANASEKWYTVTKSSDGETILVVKPSTFSAHRDKDSGSSIGAIFRTIESDKISEYFIIVNSRSCTENGGNILLRSKIGDSWENVAESSWAATGTTLYDASGQTLCAMLEMKLETERKSLPSI
jgi:hypothetical protein